MGIIVIIIIVVFGLAAVALAIGVYNSIVMLRANIKKAWANIDVIFKQRYDEIPQLIQICEQYVTYEKSIIDRIMKARENMVHGKDKEAQIEAAKEFSLGLNGLLAVGENYPDLKANQNFIQIQNRLSSLEEHLADRREFYNDSVTLYNIRIKQFPDMIFANFMGCQEEKLFEVSPEEKKLPNLKMNL